MEHVNPIFERAGLELENMDLEKKKYSAKKQSKSDVKTDKKKDKRGKWKYAFWGSIFSLSIFAMCINFTLDYKENFIKLTSAIPLVSKNLSTLATISPASGKEGAQFFTAEGLLFSLSDDKLVCYDKYAKALWEKPFASQNAEILPFSRDILVVDRSFGDLYIVSRSGEIKAQKLDQGVIREVKAKDGKIALLLKGKNYINVFDSDLSKLGSASIPKGYMTAWDFSPKTRNIAVSVISAQDKGLASSVHIMGYDGKLSESISVDGCAIYGMDFDETYLKVISDRKLACYDMPEAKVRYESNFKRNTVNFDFGDNKSIAINNAGNDIQGDGLNYKDSIVSIDKNGNPFGSVQSLAADPSIIRHAGKGTIIYGNGKIVAYDKKGKSIAGRDVAKDVIDVLVVDSTTVCIVYKSKVEVIRCSIG
jgi:hypothetical protein